MSATGRTSRPRQRVRRRCKGEDGQVALLILVCAVIAGALVLTAGAITQVHLGRQHLQSLADSAALAASDALDEQSYYATGVLPAADGLGGVPISDASVQAAAETDVGDDAAAAAPLEGLAVAAPTGTPDQRTAQVTLTARVRPWLLPRAVAAAAPTITLEITSRARAGALLP